MSAETPDRSCADKRELAQLLWRQVKAATKQLLIVNFKKVTIQKLL